MKLKIITSSFKNQPTDYCHFKKNSVWKIASTEKMELMFIML